MGITLGRESFSGRLSDGSVERSRPCSFDCFDLLVFKFIVAQVFGLIAVVEGCGRPPLVVAKPKPSLTLCGPPGAGAGVELFGSRVMAWGRW